MTNPLGSVKLEKPRVKEKTLRNGLRVLVVEEHDAPLVAVQVWYLVGSRCEGYDETGIAHLLEHMMFKGSANVEGQYSEIIDRLGGTDNAYTSRDETVYHCVVPKDALETVLMMEADRMQNLTFQGFDSELEVVKEERRWRTDNSPSGTAYEHLHALAYLVHPYHHPVIGWRSVLDSMSLNKVIAFYKKFYVPSNAVLVIVGDVDADTAFALAEKYFGPIPKAPKPKVQVPREPEQTGTRREVLYKEGFTTLLLLAWHIPEASHPDYPALDLVASALGGGKSSRLYKKLVLERGWASSVWAYAEDMVDPGLLVVGVVLQQDASVDSVEELVVSEVEAMGREGLRPQELERLKTQAIADFIYSQESAQGLAYSIGGSVLIWDNPTRWAEYPEMVAQVSNRDVMRVAKKYLDPQRRTVVRLLPKTPEDIEAYMRMMQEAQKKEFKY